MDAQHHASCGVLGRDASGSFLAGFMMNLGCCPMAVQKCGGHFILFNWLDMMHIDMFFWNWIPVQLFILSRKAHTISSLMQWL